MKKYIFLFNTKTETIVSVKQSGSEINIKHFNFVMNSLFRDIDYSFNRSLYKKDYKGLDSLLKKLKIELSVNLNRREINEPSSNQSDWKSRFTEEQMFQEKIIFGKQYMLFNGGIDNEIFWLASFYELIENCIKNKSNIYIFFNDKITEIERLKRILVRMENKNLI